MMLELVRCVMNEAIADLEGMLPEIDPGGERTHPGWATLDRLKALVGPVSEEQMAILQHTERNRRYAGAADNPDMQTLVALQLLTPPRTVSFCPDSYFTLTSLGAARLELHRCQNS